ncbi:cyclin-L1 [Eurytemora carolleeae]|uniref:cyclin-L1 n=1 Tax=Eurytemora carolleeae TaxID=1294199 RepID=UPI000C774FE6|nr:cyclin-L1 [Eurytemora carolleeae]|eukprot:XP_023349756.1 cyclin-L1-like [Eurytemora affinis]
MLQNIISTFYRITNQCFTVYIKYTLADFGRVLLTISNSVLPLDKLTPTPSSLDGMTTETEIDLRNLGCNLIQTAGKLLRLPQVAMATSCVMYQRFFYSKSYVRYNFEHVAMGCVCLASKIEESPRRPRDVINVFTHIRQVRQGKPIKPVILDPDYIRLKNDIIKAERRVLKELGFCVHIKHPHKLIVMYLQLLSYEKDHKFIQMSWNFMNDSLRTDCFVRKPSWYELLGVEEDDIRDCCYRMICLYQRKKVNQEELEKIVDKLKMVQDEKKKEARKVLTVTSTALNSPASQPSSPHRQSRKDDDRSRSRSRSKSLDRKKKKKNK